MTTTHEAQINVSIPLAAVPVDKAGFGRVALIFTDLNIGGTGARSKLYTQATGAADAAADLTATQITQNAHDAIVAVLSQNPKPRDVLLIERDLTPGAATYSDAFNAAIADSGVPSFYGVAIESRVPADIEAMSATIEAAGPYFFVFQDNETEWLAGGPHADYTNIAGRERSALSWHSDDTKWGDAAWLASRLVFDPDIQSAGWTGKVAGVGVGTTVPSAGELVALTGSGAYGNVGLPFGSAAYYMSPGQNVSGRPIYEMITKDWLKARLTERLIDIRLEHDTRGDKIGADADGEALVEKEIRAQVLIGEGANHFIEDALVDENGNNTLSVTSDASTRTITASGQVRTLTDVIYFNVTLALTR